MRRVYLAPNTTVMLKKILGCGLLALSMAATACVDYPEGGELNPWPPQERVINTWGWAYALEDGQNLTGSRADSTLEISRDGVVRICASDGGCREGTWNLVRKKTKLQFLFGTRAEAYDILLLRVNEMWLKYSDSTRTVEWELTTHE
jgi:hypothetical protein